MMNVFTADFDFAFLYLNNKYEYKTINLSICVRVWFLNYCTDKVKRNHR